MSMFSFSLKPTPPLASRFQSYPLYLPLPILFVLITVSILTYVWLNNAPRPQRYYKMTKHHTLSEHLVSLCHDRTKTVSHILSQDPSLPPSKASAKLFGAGAGANRPSLIDTPLPHEQPPASAEELEIAKSCGDWGREIGGQEPSELFLRVFRDALLSLEGDPLEGVCSPSLMGSCGVLPLTVVGSVWDICRHMSNLIARAEREVFLATNYWIDSDASRFITDGLRELSRRAGERGEKAIVKLMYDRGNLKQLWDNHQKVPKDDYMGKMVRLPGPDEIPNVDMEVVNYHRPALGTFHSKFMVVDRKIAVVSSNNIQKNDNLEMMVHVEGPIVDSFYETAIISWGNSFDPPLPSHKTPAAEGGLPTFQQDSFQSLHEPSIPESGNARSLAQITVDGQREALSEHLPGDPHYDEDIAGEVHRMQSVLSVRDGEDVMEVISRHLNQNTHDNRKATAPPPPAGHEPTPYIPHPVHKPFPMAMVNRKPFGAPNHSSVYNPQNAAWLSLVANAKSTIFIQTPDLNAEPLLPAILAAVRRGITVTYYVCLGYNDAGELLPMQGGHNEGVAHKLYQQLAEPEEKERLNVHYYVAADQNIPIHNSFKSRSCHIKILIADSSVGVLGNGNQDTQSWYHSQEVNLMVDSVEVCRRWEDGLRRCQNTDRSGKAVKEGELAGCWVEPRGEGDEGKITGMRLAEGSIGVDAGGFAWAKGIVGAVKRVQGAGGF
ncbi:MAG: hypothetical protein M1820_001445 [Bogoriella megaspora]|nr:MAG: hypothetical protein M1820_001445 [Bogoriella megaspora]